MRFWKLMLLGQQNSSSRGLVNPFWAFVVLTSFIYFHICQPSRAVVQVHSQASQPNFGGASHCSAKGRPMPKMSNHLFQWVAAGCWSLLLWVVFFPLLFCFCCWLTTFSHPWYSFSLRVPLLPCVSFLLSYLKDIHVFQHGWKFDLCAVCSPADTSYFHTSMKHRGAQQWPS